MQNFQTDSGKKVHLRFKIKSERFKEMSRERLDNNKRRWSFKKMHQKFELFKKWGRFKSCKSEGENGFTVKSIRLNMCIKTEYLKASGLKCWPLNSDFVPRSALRLAAPLFSNTFQTLLCFYIHLQADNLTLSD